MKREYTENKNNIYEYENLNKYYDNYNVESSKNNNITDDMYEIFDINFLKNLEDIPFNEGKIAFILPENQSDIDGNKFIENVMNHPQIKINSHVSPIKLNNEKELNKRKDVLAAVIFNKDFFHYNIRINDENVVDSKKEPIEQYAKTILTKEFCLNFAVEEKGYEECISDASVYQVGFIHLQIAVDNAILDMKINNPLKKSFGKYFYKNLKTFNNPGKFIYSFKDDDEKYSLIGYALTVPLLFLGQVFHLGNRIMEEKESKIKEGFVAIGAHRSLFWLSWEITYLPFVLICIIFTGILNPGKLFSVINILF